MSGFLNVRSGGRRTALAVAFVCLVLLSACKIVSIDEDRALRARGGGDLDASAYVGDRWAGRVVPELHRRVVPAATLLPAVDAGLAGAGARYGRQASEGAAWTFVIGGTGRVVAVDRASRRGTVTLALDGASPARMVVVQTGSVVSGTAIRDALSTVAFNDFSDQLVFADVGRALTARAMAGVRRELGVLRPGDHVRLAGVYQARRADDPLVVTPFALTRDAGAS